MAACQNTGRELETHRGWAALLGGNPFLPQLSLRAAYANAVAASAAGRRRGGDALHAVLVLLGGECAGFQQEAAERQYILYDCHTRVS